MDARTIEFAAAEVEARFFALLSRVEAGEEIMIKRDGKVVARLSPVTRAASGMSVEQQVKAWDDWFAYRDANDVSLPAGVTTKDLIEDGRRT